MSKNLVEMARFNKISHLAEKILIESAGSGNIEKIYHDTMIENSFDLAEKYYKEWERRKKEIYK